MWKKIYQVKLTPQYAIMKFTYLKQPPKRYTFEQPKLKEWIESIVRGKVLNLFAGKTELNCNEVRNDLDKTMLADYNLDAYEFIKKWKGEKFDTIILDPPYSLRKGMRKYNGKYMSSFKRIKDIVPLILKDNGLVITFGYHSVSMGKSRGFKQKEICLISHAGAHHDTIVIVEQK